MTKITFLCDEVNNNINSANTTEASRMKLAGVNSLTLSPHHTSSPHSGVVFREFKANHRQSPDCYNYIKRLQSIIDTIKDPTGPWHSKLNSGGKPTISDLLITFMEHFKCFYNAKNKLLQQRISNSPYDYVSKKALITAFHKEMVAYLRNTLLPDILKTISSSAEQLRRAEIRYQSKRGRPALLHIYPLASATTPKNSTARYVSYQKSIGRYTQNQLTYLNKTSAEQHYFKNCYDRFETGVANMQWQVVGHLKDFGDKSIQLSSAYLRHSNIYRTKTNDPLAKQCFESVLDAEQIIETAAEKIVIDRCRSQSKDASTFAAQHDESNPLPITLHELRLMSVLHKSLDEVDPDQRGRWQMENNFIAFNLCQKRAMKVKVIDAHQQEHSIWVKPEIALSDFGVNIMRHEALNDPLQDWMNTRALNMLWQNVCAHLPVTTTSRAIFQTIEDDAALKDALSAVEISQQNLASHYQSFLTLVNTHHHNNDPTIIATVSIKRDELLQLEEQHFLLEKRALDIRFHLFNIKKQDLMGRLDNPFFRDIVETDDTIEKSVMQLWLNVLTLYNKARYTDADNTYLLQGMWGLLAQQLGNVFASGCNDNKDRGSRHAEKIEALTIFYREHDCFPRLYDPDFEQQDKAELCRIEAVVHERSTALYGTELSSLPGCFGEQVKASDGNAHLNLLHCSQAELGKGLYKDSQHSVGKIAYIQAGFSFVWNKITSTIHGWFRSDTENSTSPVNHGNTNTLALADMASTEQPFTAPVFDKEHLEYETHTNISDATYQDNSGEMVHFAEQTPAQETFKTPLHKFFKLISIGIVAIASVVLVATPITSSANSASHNHVHGSYHSSLSYNTFGTPSHAHKNTTRRIEHIFRVADHRETQSGLNKTSSPRPVNTSRRSDPKKDDDTETSSSEFNTGLRKIYHTLTPQATLTFDDPLLGSNHEDNPVHTMSDLTPTHVVTHDVNLPNKENQVMHLGNPNQLAALKPQTTSYKHLDSPKPDKWVKINQAQQTINAGKIAPAQNHNDINTQENSEGSKNTANSNGATQSNFKAIRYYDAQKTKSELPPSLPSDYFYSEEDYSNPSLSS